ncbi:hypothetical protein [Paenibacillus sp. y28]|uniref:hypothetical protein n=1 Tax=Paenibacillus sp. y28 TaxID=3129110 RepID=UPI003017298E
MIAGKRAELSGKLTHVLDARSLAASHPRLAELLRPGMTVLDVGCGTGAITRRIAEAVGVTPQHEHTVRAAPDFLSRIRIWADTASSRGVQMERDGYITVQDYLSAEQDYQDWIQTEAQMMTMYMLSVEL